MFYPCWARCDHSTVFPIPNKNQIPLVWRSSKERLEVALHSVYFCMTPKDISCELFALCWRAKCVKSSQLSRFPLNLKRFAHRFLCASRTRPFQYRFATVIEWPATTALCRVCETQNSGKALLFFAKQVKIPENALGFLGSQAESKSCLQQIYAPVFIMRQMLSPFSRMRPAFEDAANIQFSLYRVCLRHHKTQEALCSEMFRV